jgi:drug/metabolite transporter (DMT)-like permease
MSVFCIIPAANVNWSVYGLKFWGYVILAGLFCSLGTICLIKALQNGELSVLGPINSYKCIIGLFSAFILLGEIPSLFGLTGLILIVIGSWFIFDTIEEQFTYKVFLRKEIQLRFLALLFTGIEAAFLKKIIIMSSFQISFILWAFSGFISTFFFMIFLKRKFNVIKTCDYMALFFISICLSIMQLSTNYVFKYIEVGLALALFQLSSLVTLFLGWKYFEEKNILKKLVGTLIMLIGSTLILLIK